MGRSPGVTYLLIIQVYILLVVHGQDLWQVQDNCGFKVGKNEVAGVLQLDTETLVRGRGYRDDCKVTVVPATLPGGRSNGRVLFYFTRFELPGTCSEFNVTLLDGSSSYAKHVIGAPNAFCLHNKTLIDPYTVFNTSTSEFSVLIRWKSSLSSPYGGFELKFASFYEGNCDPSDEVTECTNTRCTASEYHCSEDIYTCGKGELDVCATETAEEAAVGFWESILETVKTWGVILAVLVGLGLAWNIFKAYGQKIRDRITTQLTSQPTVRSRSPSIRTVELSQQCNTTEPLEPQRDDSIEIQLSLDEDTISISSSSSLDLPGQTDPTAPPSYDELSPAPSASPQLFPSAPPFAPPSTLPPAPPSAPPPSYDEFISNEHVYK